VLVVGDDAAPGDPRQAGAVVADDVADDLAGQAGGDGTVTVELSRSSARRR
jgi:hypothetical protein